MRLLVTVLVGVMAAMTAIAAEYSWIYRGPGMTGAADALALDDGGLILAGAWTAAPGEDTDTLLLRVDAAGNEVWARTIGGGGDDLASALIRAADGTNWLAGITRSVGAGAADVLVLKFRDDGAVLWQHTYGSTTDDSAFAMAATADGGAYVVGSTYDVDPAAPYLLIMQLGPSGEMNWRQAYGPYCAATAVVSVPDGGCVAAGYRFDPQTTETDHLALRVLADGSPIWSKIYAGEGLETVKSMVSPDGESFYLAGTTGASGEGGQDWHVLKLDGAGDVQWQYTYGGPGDELFPVIAALPGGGCVLAGPATAEAGDSHTDLTLMEISAAGVPAWQRRIVLGPDGTGGVVTRQGGLAAFGMLSDTFGVDGDLLLFGLDSQGAIPGCPVIQEASLVANAAHHAASAVSLLEQSPVFVFDIVSLAEAEPGLTAGDACAATPTPEAPTPTRTPPPSPTPSGVPGSPTTTPTPTPVCPMTGVSLTMPDSFFRPGDTCYLEATVCNGHEEPLVGYPLFIILDVYGEYWFAPSWNQELDYYAFDLPPGPTVFRPVPEFSWPAGDASATGIVFWGALLDPGMTEVAGNIGRFEFGFGP